MSDIQSTAPQGEQPVSPASDGNELSVEELESVAGGDGEDDLAGNGMCPTVNAYKCTGLTD